MYILFHAVYNSSGAENGANIVIEKLATDAHNFASDDALRVQAVYGKLPDIYRAPRDFVVDTMTQVLGDALKLLNAADDGIGWEVNALPQKSNDTLYVIARALL